MDTYKVIETALHKVDAKTAVRCTYGLDSGFAERNNQEPHFAITGETFALTSYQGQRANASEDVIEYRGKRYILTAGGCLHDMIREHFPHLAHLIKWHLVSTREPLHYVANSLYWLREGNRANFESACVIGSLLNDQYYSWKWFRENEDRTQERLAERLPALMDLFRGDMIRAKVIIPEQKYTS